jgi:hypothetical protein
VHLPQFARQYSGVNDTIPRRSRPSAASEAIDGSGGGTVTWQRWRANLSRSTKSS